MVPGTRFSLRTERSSRCEPSRQSGDAISRDARLACKQHGSIEFVCIIGGAVSSELGSIGKRKEERTTRLLYPVASHDG